ncbi:hypothetical protein BOTBODRAFT_229246 [Botryobasidium botryosum FD-172 SS1]|uniref:Secreted protein n=1 Tax=Botryobasidium botryosum (strain FD-172 SS1) TaxID=930990 RepID=A0A067LUJ9_BOTB1|nr:hypothetical protein BOTBODRAFT_229246 [Botryobasidium botryosum FD-172 SS1]
MGDSVLNITSVLVVIAFRASLLLKGVDTRSAVNVTALWARGYSLPEHPPCDLVMDTTHSRRRHIVLTATCPVISDDAYYCQDTSPTPC